MATGGHVDPRTPVIAGVGQVNVPGADAPEPVELLAEAARLAGEDSGSARLLPAVRSVRVVRIVSWRYRDPAALVAARLGLGAVGTVATTHGGQTPQSLVDRAAEQIRDGRLEVALIGGAESFCTRQAYHARGERPPWTVQADGVAPGETAGTELHMVNDTEEELGLRSPAQIYPLFESALRARAGRPLGEHRLRIAELWASLSEVGARNPFAAIRRAVPAEEIATPTPSNRMVGFPYTKLMNANAGVNQAAALLVCSAERARALGVPVDRWVFLHAAAEANEVPYLSNRLDLSASVALRVAGRAVFERARASLDDVAHLDLYSCFPSALQVAARELGLDRGGEHGRGADPRRSRPLTVTGGLTFAGGPWNNYVTHALATMTGLLRADPGSLGLVTANGGVLSKQAVGLYSSAPPRHGFVTERPQAAVDRHPRRALVPDYRGPGVIEATTVLHARDGAPERAFAACAVASGARAWCTSADHDVMAAMMKDGLEGASVHIGEGRRLEL